MKIHFDELIASLTERIAEVLNPMIPMGTKCALLDFPNYGNVGDSAIWLGEKAFLRSRAAEVIYACDKDVYRKDTLKKRLHGGTILLTGGGNLGDIWLHHQRFREKIILNFPNSRIIQLPQSIYFKEKANLERTRIIFNNHPDLTLLVRDEHSLEIARNEFHARSYLCPDMAFMLGPLSRPESPQNKIVWLARTDGESRGCSLPCAESDIYRTDWRKDPRTLFFRANNFLIRQCRQNTPVLGRVASWMSPGYDSLARYRLRHGCTMLSRGQIVITDRLHGHILCVLMGIPNVVLDNNYGKVKNFYERWTKDCALTFWADSLDDALAAARSLALALNEPLSMSQKRNVLHTARNN